MKKKYTHIKENIERIKLLQESHIGSFQTELLPDLDQQQTERKKAFEYLHNTMKSFMEEAEKYDMTADDEKQLMVQEIINDIKILMDQNKVLKCNVLAYKNDLQNHMKKVSDGRKKIGGYRMPASFANRPRAINVTN